MTGPFNGNGFKLQLDRVVGNSNICLGLKHIGEKEYAPASSLYENIKKKAKFTNQVVAVYMKKKDEALFCDLKYTAKSFDVDSIDNDEILKLIKK